MTAQVQVAGRAASARRFDVVRDHPEWLVLLVSLAGWVWLGTVLAGAASTPGAQAGHAGHQHGPVQGDPFALPAASGSAAMAVAPIFAAHLGVWLAMTIAMMLPTTVPHVRYIGFAVRESRRQRAILWFGFGYLVVWLAPGMLLAVLPPAPPMAVAIAVLVAGAWEWTPVKRRMLRRCCRTWPVRYAGPASDASALEYGIRHGLTCLAVSGPAMAALMLAGHPWWATAALSVLMAAQKLLSAPDRWRTPVAIGWLAGGVALTGFVISG